MCINFFADQDYALAFQCHPEFKANALESWLIGHACELAKNAIDIRALREDCQTWSEKLARQGQ
ncbi:hypothetical protein [Thiomicrorhabdus sp.]|uniref:hypothetical protein n=1 Tax=Thiomicrorhabdus sp. TaxID=2039724 RepID=UPI0029C96B0B|nr:hypothetical protein [Thiomicrorhabdus sp.]